MDDQRKNQIDPERHPQRNRPKKLQTHNLLAWTWKILTAHIREEIYDSLKSRGQFSEEQKGCCKGTREKKATVHWSTYPQRESDEMKISSYGVDWQQKFIWYIPQSWIINCLKMYKISDEVIKFIEKTMKTWRVELTAEGKSLSEAKIHRGIFQGDALSQLQLVIAMMPRNHILRKCTGGYKLTKSQENINHLMYMDDIKLYKKQKRIGKPTTGSENIQLRHRDGIWFRKGRHTNYEKQEMAHNGRNRTTK